VDNAFNYSSPEYQVGFQLNVPLRNRIAKADQYRTELEYRQSQVYLEELKKRIRIEVRNAAFALEQGASRVDAARTARDLAQKTLDITSGNRSSGPDRISRRSQPTMIWLWPSRLLYRRRPTMKRRVSK